MRRILQRNLTKLVLIVIALQLNFKGSGQVIVGSTYQMISQHPTGGILKDTLGYYIHTFLTSDSLKVPAGFSTLNMEVLVLGGGGGGGFNPGGGGGAGGLIDTPNIVLNKSQVIIVGSGGQGSFVNFIATGYHGSSSQFGYAGFTAFGGGGGGSDGNSGGYGASGGGGSNGSLGGNTGNFGQGYKGGDQNKGLICCDSAGAGGGGAGMAGGNTAVNMGSNGGVGATSQISGKLVYYAGGGGGGFGNTTVYSGGLGGGGKGGSSNNLAGSTGDPNTGGGGGGGGSNSSSSGAGADGGSGIVIARYPYSVTGIWTSDNTAIATVGPSSGIASGKAYGSANIIYTSTAGAMVSTYTQILNVTFPLPITLLYFQATYSNCKANIIWKSTSEINSSYYIIEFSKDGAAFKQAAKLASMNRTAGATYTQAFTNLSAGRVYYRLKMVDLDGKFTYSKIVTIDANDNCNATIPLSVKPNPASDVITINGLVKGSILSLINSAGLKLLTTQAIGSSQLINIKQYPNGVYMLRVETANGIIQTLKLVKK